MLKKAGVRQERDLCPQLALGPPVSTSTAGAFSLSCQGSVEYTEDCLGAFTEEQNLFFWLPPSFSFY